MKCPNCCSPIIETIKVCRACETKYTNSELVELLQLKFLLAETAKWTNCDQQRGVYTQRLRTLQNHIEGETQSLPPIPTTSALNTEQVPVSSKPSSTSFDQWLFSEATIKLALYAGGILLVLAGFIFIGANWSNLPTIIKLLVTLSITGSMYGAGSLLFQSANLRTGSLALLGVASGFAPLNFIVLHIYFLESQGVDFWLTWLIGSVICLLLYLITTFWTRGHLFTYLSVLAVFSAITALLELVDSPLSGFIMVYACLPIPLLIIAFLVRSPQAAGFIYWPCIITTAILGVILTLPLISVAIFEPEVFSITLMLFVLAGLYGIMAVLTDWVLLLLPALLAAELIPLSGYRLIDKLALTPLTLSYATLGVALIMLVIGLRLSKQTRWLWPFYLFALFDLSGSYLASLFLAQPWPIIISTAFALIALGLTWVEKSVLERNNLAPLPTFVGIFLIFIGHFYILDLLSRGQNSDIWTIITAGLCGLFVLIGWLFPNGLLHRLYGAPFQWVGLGLTIIPLTGNLATGNEPVGVVTFTIIGLIYILDGLGRRWIYQIYLGTGLFVGAMLWLLSWQEVEPGQAYILPFGLWLVGLAWTEQYRRQTTTFLFFSIIGLSTLLGSAFIQSLTSTSHALLFLLEGLIVLIIGLGARSRSYVMIGLISLILNGLAQFIPAFAELPRFIQIGSIGATLLVGGLIALFQREQMINLGHSFRLQWQKWEV